MAYNIIVSPRAQQEIEDAIDYYSKSKKQKSHTISVANLLPLLGSNQGPHN